MNRHEEAVEHIESAIAILHDDERQISYRSSEHEDTDGKREEQHQEVVSTLVVAYYNHWVELGRLSRREAGIDCILRAANIAKRKLGTSHPLTIKMEETLGTVQEQHAKPQSTALSLDIADALGDTDRQGLFPSGTTSSQLPALDSRAAWQNAKRDEPLKLAVDAPQITLRYQPEPFRPQPPPGPKPSLSDNLKQLRAREHIYGRSTHPILGSSSPEPISAVFDSRPRITKAAGSAGSPGLLQQAHGVQPMLSVRSAREGARPPPVSPAHAIEKARTQSPAPKIALEPKPPLEAPLSPYIREAYAYYNKAVAKKKNMDGQEDPELPLEPSRVKAIGVFKGRLEKRRNCGLPTPTENNRVRAATMMQALWRGYVVRQWSVEELAKDVHRRRHIAATSLVQHSPDDNSSEAEGYTSQSHGPPDMKRRVAFRVVYAARRAFVEYSAAVKMQKLWRGYVTRRDIRLEIARVATHTATKLQALFRRYSVVIRFIRYAFFATTMQTFWRRALARRRAKRRLDAAKLLTRASTGYSARKKLLISWNAAVPIQCTVRGYLARLHLRRCHRGALALQRVFHGWKCRRKLAEKSLAVSKVAACWRSYALRKHIQLKHVAAYRIQRRYRLSRVSHSGDKEFWAAAKVGAAWRGYQLRQRKPYRRSACTIQSHFRGVLARKKLRRLPCAALRIQSAWRGYYTRNIFKRLVALVRVLQKLTKRHLVKNKVDEVVAATVVCQKIVRGVRARKAFERVVARISRVQAIWRRSSSRQAIARRERCAQQIQAFVRKCRDRHKYNSYKQAATCIKAAWNARRIRLTFTELCSAAKVIAKWMRGHLVRRCMKQLHASATLIQRGWRGYHSRLVLERRKVAAAKIKAVLLGRYRQICFNTFRLRAVIGIQRLWRAHVARRRFRAQQSIARILQNQVRGQRHRQQVKQEHRAATHIQAAWRRVMWKARVDLRNQSVIKLQSAYLGMLDRKRIKQRNKVAVLTQCIVRSHAARAEKDMRATAARKIARWLRARTDRSRFLRIRKAVSMMQDHFRSRQTRRRYLKLKRFVTLLEADSRQHGAAARCKKQLAAVATIQKCWRRTAVNMKLHNRVVSAIVIQKYIRGWLAVLNARRTQTEKLELVLKLQSHWRRKKEQRRYLTKRKVQKAVDGLLRCFVTRHMIRAKMREPATKIVTAAKAYLTKKRLANERDAATKIQKVWKGRMARKEIRFMHNEGPAAIQSCTRIRKAHEVVETKRYYTYRQLDANLYFFRHWKEDQKEEAAALRIQTFYRMRFHQRSFQKKIKWALPRIQALSRMFLDRDEYRAKKEAAIYIQKCVRAYCITKLPVQLSAARRIQRVWRQFLVKPNKNRQQFSEFATQSFACLHIQTAFRRYVHTWRFLRVLVAAVRIQAIVRKHLQKKKWRQQVDAARSIQVSLILIWLARRKADRKRRAALKITSFARRALVNLRVRRERAAAVKIQAAWRSALCRWLVMERQRRAATKLQASVRMHFQRDKAHPRRQVALRTIQAHARGFAVRSRIARQNAAAARIQIRYRINRSQLRLKTTRWLVLALQKLWRGRCSRRKTSKMMRLVRIPALARGRLWRREWIEVIAAVTAIQRIWRGRLDRHSMQDLHMAATRLQAAWRSYSAKKNLKTKKSALKTIQRMMMQWRLNKGAKAMRDVYTLAARAHEAHGPVEIHRAQIDAIVTIQRVERGIVGRERVRNMQAAACTIQKYARRWLVQRSFRRRWKALWKIQAFVDGAYRRRARAIALARIVKLQNHCRMRVARQQFCEKRLVQTHIARIARGHASRRRLAREKEAAEAITSYVRIWLGIKRYRGQKQAATSIQSRWRGKLDRDEIETKSAAATLIGKAWRRSHWLRKHRQRCHAGLIVVGGAIMWKQLRLRRCRVNAARNIQAAWRSCCARANIQQMHDAARKIQEWWKNLQSFHVTSNLVVEILVQSKLIREAYAAKHALIVQRSFRRWRDHKMVISFKRMKRGIVLLQSHYRRRRAARHVEFYREFIGIKVRHLVQNNVIVFPDAQGKLTRSRDVVADDCVEELPPPQFLARRVNIAGLSTKQRDRLAAAVTPIQSLAKWRSKCSRVVDIQRVWRGHLARKMLQNRRRSSTRIQAAWRAKIARAQLEEARTSATKIEARFRGASARKEKRQMQEERDASEQQDDYEVGDEVVDGRRVRRGGSVLG